MVRRHVWVSGQVQGVWFRDTCAEEAKRLGLSGWVRNLPDMRVEAVFEGDEHAVDTAVAWCKVGPPHAHVTGVDVRDETPYGETSFDILW